MSKGVAVGGIWLLAAVLACPAFATSIFPSFLPVTSTVPESGYAGLQNLPAYPLGATPYDFNGQFNPFAFIDRIDSITLTLTMADGDTAAGDFDFGNLYLALDGVNTGLALNGFPNNQILSLSLNQLSPATSDALVAALQDGQLLGSVLDLTPGNGPAGDTIAFPRAVDTTLDLVLHLSPPPPPPVPLPPAVWLALSSAGLAMVESGRRRGCLNWGR
jgi:hypothetical protein